MSIRVLQKNRNLEIQKALNGTKFLRVPEGCKQNFKKSENILILILALEVFAVMRTRLRDNFDNFGLFVNIFHTVKIY